MIRQWFKVAPVGVSTTTDVLAFKADDAAEEWCKKHLTAEDGPVCVVVTDPRTEPPHNRNVFEVSARVVVEWDAKHIG